ncbi:hypothetical protein EDC01DRAFT_788463 [Geopyxis carbonaria]|nr:hypothetical protein EDC01DRAFT_788463 [Geopyxis carbonaria]
MSILHGHDEVTGWLACVSANSSRRTLHDSTLHLARPHPSTANTAGAPPLLLLLLLLYTHVSPVCEDAPSPPTPHDAHDAPRPRRHALMPTPPPPRRRRTSTISEVSPSPPPSLRSVEEALVPTSADGSTWHSLPLAFAVLPAVGGLLVTDGSLLVTDVMLLVLATVFLHWLVKFPWEWYHASQPSASASGQHDGAAAADEADARAELRTHALAALLCCFLGPVLGGALLHSIRTQLSRPSEGLVSTFNLTIFVLAAELRPAALVVRLVRARSLHLHARLHLPPPARVDALEARVEDLAEQLRALAAREADVDALNRAVRRYEKKEAAAAALTDTRISEIDGRLHDVLAQAAARQRPPRIAALLRWPFALAWRVVALPARAVEVVTGVAARRLLGWGTSAKEAAGATTGRGGKRVSGRIRE